MNKIFSYLSVVLLVFVFANSVFADPFILEIEESSIPGTPAIHSFAFAESGGKWLFIGGRTNGLHGFNAVNSFPKQYSNVNLFVVDPTSGMTWSRNIFQDLHYSVSDQFRAANMQSFQRGNKLFITGGYGYDSTSNGLITFPKLSVIDVGEIMQAVISGVSVSPFVRQITDSRMQVCGGEMHMLGDYFYLIGGHVFTGTYRRNVNNQIYTDQIRKFKINDNGISVNISDYSAFTDTVEFHRRDMNVVPAIMPDGISEYLILYGGVFKRNADLPYLNPVYINENSINVDYTYEQKMSQYTCANMVLFDALYGDYHTTFFAGTSLYSYNEISHSLEYDSLVPFINDITVLTKKANGSFEENITNQRFPALLGTNAKFILNESVPHYENGIIKLDQITGRVLAGYIFGGIEALLPNNGNSFPSQRIFKVYITHDIPMPVELSNFFSSVNGRNVNIYWTTSSEINNSGFYIERSVTDNLHSEWITLGFIAGQGNSTAQVNYAYEDKNPDPGKYFYRLKQTDFNGNYEYFNLESIVNIGNPERFMLTQNYPNPFNPSTKIKFEIPYNTHVNLKIYDNAGNEIATLVDEFKSEGYYTVGFSGSELASGIYFAKFESGNYSQSIKMFLIK